MGLMAQISRLGRAIRNRVVRMAESIGFPSIDDMQGIMTAPQHLWKQMYLNKAPWVQGNVKSMNLAAIVAAEVSRLVTLDLESIVDDVNINAIYQREIMGDIRTQVEYGLALGGIMLKPYVINDSVRVDFAQPSDFHIIRAANDGTVLEVVFKDYLLYNEDWYVRLEYHNFNELTNGYVIQNRVFKSDDNGEIGGELRSYEAIEPWAHILPVLELQNIKAPLFGYFRPAMSNNIDTKSAVGVSIYSRAIDAIERADNQLSALLREFRVKEAKQYVSSLAVKGTGPLPYLEDDFYIKMNMSGGKSGSEDFFESYSPEIHVEAYLQALNEYKREIEDCIGMAHGTISDPTNVTMTATEVKQTKHRSAVLISGNQKNLQQALEGAVYAISVWLKYPTAPSEITVTSKWDESSWTDWDAEVKGMLEDVVSGLLNPVIYIMKKYGVTEEEAIRMMPNSEQLLAGAQPGNQGVGINGTVAR